MRAVYRVFLFLGSLLCTCSSFAITLDEVVVNGIYYHDAWANNNRVRVLAIHGSKVEIIFLEGANTGEIDRVYPQDLLTRTDSMNEEAEDYGQAAAVTVLGLAAIACAFSDDCNDDSSLSSSSYSSTQTTNETEFKFLMKNDCRHPVKLALNYQESNGDWRQIGWWNFEPFESSYLSLSEGEYITTKNSVFYYYAEFVDGSYIWSGDDHFLVDGVELPMRKMKDDAGDSEWEISCPGK